MAQKKKKKTRQQKPKKLTNPSFVSRVTYVVVVYLALAGLLVVVAALLVLALWITSIPNWTAFFTYLQSDVLLGYVKVLVWPIFAVVVLILLRKEIVALINRIKSVKWGDKSADFESGPQPVSTAGTTLTDTDDRAQQPNETDTAYRERIYADLAVQLAFERVYRNIYGTQIGLLNFLAANGGPVVTSALEPFYQRHLDLLNGGKNYFNNVHDYAAYLTTNALAEYNAAADTYKLQGLVGSLFLRYIAEQGISDPNMKPL